MATCYWPNGQIDPVSQPCNPDHAVSQCCQSTHICLSNGLCFDTEFNHIIRVTCTDETWEDPSCGPYCKTYNTGGIGDMRQCDNTDRDWVCGLDTSNCESPTYIPFTVSWGYVDDNRKVNIPGIIAVPSMNSAAAATATGSVATVTTTVTATPSPVSSATPKTNSTLTVGLGAGLGVGLPLLAALLFTLFLLYRARKTLRNVKSASGQVPTSEVQSQSYPLKWQTRQEPDSGYIHEAGAGRPDRSA